MQEPRHIEDTLVAIAEKPFTESCPTDGDHAPLDQRRRFFQELQTALKISFNAVGRLQIALNPTTVMPDMEDEETVLWGEIHLGPCRFGVPTLELRESTGYRRGIGRTVSFPQYLIIHPVYIPGDRETPPDWEETGVFVPERSDFHSPAAIATQAALFYLKSEVEGHLQAYADDLYADEIRAEEGRGC